VCCNSMRVGFEPHSLLGEIRVKMPFADPASRRAFLRESTRLLHQELDAAASGIDLRHPADYAAMLLDHAHALVPLEFRLERSGVETILPDWNLRCRREALKADLSGLGQAMPPMTPATHEDTMPAFTRSEAFGVLYVLEGARLGGAVLARLVVSSWSETVRANNRYFSHGQGAGFWPDFLERLETAPDLVMDDVLAGAKTAFAAFLAASRSTRIVHPEDHAEAAASNLQ